MKIQHKLVSILFLVLSVSLQAQLPFLKHRNVVKIEDWGFKKGITNYVPTVKFNDSDWQQVSVPHTFSMDAINDIGYYRGQAWYRTDVEIPESMKNERIFLRFEGVGQEATVYLNNKKIGNHIGGYSAFCYEITDAVTLEGKNSLTVNVTNEPNFKRIPVDDALFNHYGGMYRPVELFSTPKCAISPMYYASSGVFVEVKKVTNNAAQLEVRTHISTSSEAQNAVLKYVVKNAKDEVVFEGDETISIAKKEAVISKNIEIQQPILWNGRINPHQYAVEVSLSSEGKTDKVVQKFGIKTFSIDANTGFILNNKAYRLNGVCKHQEWKQFGPALSDENLTTDMELIDEIGATSLRLSHYQHSDKTYQLADEKGILVWAEIPFVHDYSGREQGNAKQQLTELILQNYNHPSIFTWGLWNEVRAWNDPNEPCVELTEDLNKLAHQLDRTRLTTSASDRDMASSPMEKISDLQAWNKYFGWYYGAYEDMGTWLDASHKNHPEIKIGLSEYGVGGNIDQQDRNRVEKPVGDYFPEMEQSKYHEITWRILKDRPFVWGTFVWNMFDFSVAGWNRGGIQSLNHKGLVTFDRTTKKDAFYFYKANWSKLPVLYIAERRNVDRTVENTSVKIYTNLSKVTLYVNNKKIAAQKLTSAIKIISFEDIVLQKGENTIKVVSNDRKNQLEDTVIWNYK